MNSSLKSITDYLFILPISYLFNESELSKHPVEGFSAGLVDNDNIYEV